MFFLSGSTSGRKRSTVSSTLAVPAPRRSCTGAWSRGPASAPLRRTGWVRHLRSRPAPDSRTRWYTALSPLPGGNGATGKRIFTNGLFQQMVDRVPHKAFFLSFSSFWGEKVPLLRNVRPSGLGTEKPPRACFFSRKKEALSRHPDYTGCGAVSMFLREEGQNKTRRGKNRRVKQLERTVADSAGQVWRERSMDGGTASHLRRHRRAAPSPPWRQRAST